MTEPTAGVATASGPAWPTRRAFATATAILGLFLTVASAPSPLYSVYAAAWQFSAIHLTGVFAVYALALLGTLLVAGSLSDAVGRRPVLLAGCALLALALVVFLLAQGLVALYVARVVQGVATGLITSAVAAALIDFQPADRPSLGALVNAVTPTFGLALGGVLAGALVQYAPAPTRLVYVVLLVATAAVTLAVAGLPEPVVRRRRFTPGLRIGLEPAVRTAFLLTTPCLVATWALGGLYLSLGPSIAYALQHSTNRLLGGAVVALLAGTGGLASVACNTWPARRAMLAGCAALATGLSVTVAGIAVGSIALFCLGSVVAGAGFGAGFLGAFRTVIVLAAPARRSEVAAAIYTTAYLSFSLPAVLAGILTTRIGLRATAIGYGSALIALVLGALLLMRRTPTAAATPTPVTDPSLTTEPSPTRPLP